MANQILQVKGLKKYFPIRKGFFNRVVGNVMAVNDVDFEVCEGETVASCPLVAAEDVAEWSFGEALRSVLRNWLFRLGEYAS